MANATQKIVQYLDEAHASETGLVASPVADRDDPARHLPDGARAPPARDAQPRRAARDAARGAGHGGNPLQAGIGVAESVVAQALAIGKTPFDLLRGSGGEEKVLKNAKDAAPTEALEIATYTAIERLANAVGDDETARLAVSIRTDEEKMLARVLERSRSSRRPWSAPTSSGNGSLRHHQDRRGRRDPRGRRDRPASAPRRRKRARRARPARSPAPRAPRARPRAPSPAEQDLPIARYDALTADEIVGRLPELSRSTSRRSRLRAQGREPHDGDRAHPHAARNEPWAGYDEQTVEEIRTALGGAATTASKAARDYERAHKNRAGVLEVADRELASSAS